MEDNKRPDRGFYNVDAAALKGRYGRSYKWSPDDLHPSRRIAVPPNLAAQGWRPISEVPKNRYVALYFKGGSVGDYEGAGAFYLEDDVWHVAESKMIFTGADMAIAWKRWTKQGLAAEPTPPKGRRG